MEERYRTPRPGPGPGEPAMYGEGEGFGPRAQTHRGGPAAGWQDPDAASGGYRPPTMAEPAPGARSAGATARRMPKSYTRSDERIREDIYERLLERSFSLDVSEVVVEVRDAVVTLTGEVPTRRMKHAIEDLVDECPGVRDIDNRLRVTGLVRTLLGMSARDSDRPQLEARADRRGPRMRG